LGGPREKDKLRAKKREDRGKSGKKKLQCHSKKKGVKEPGPGKKEVGKNPLIDCKTFAKKKDLFRAEKKKVTVPKEGGGGPGKIKGGAKRTKTLGRQDKK